MNSFSLPIAYAGGDLDRVTERREDPGWVAAQYAAGTARIVPFLEDRPAIVVGADGSARPWWCPVKPGTGMPAYADPVVLLGLDSQGAARFAATIEQAPRALDGAIKWIDMRSLATQGLLSPGDLSTLAQAKALIDWHATNRFCARCGAETEAAGGGYRRYCGSCDTQHFPRVNPVVIIAVACDGHLLLGRSPHFPAGRYSTLAGFIEPGESIEEAARREVFEEAGVSVTEVSYHATQPWPFPSTLMIGCLGTANEMALEIDRTEIEDARWFPASEVRAMLDGTHDGGLDAPPPFAIAHHLLRAALATM